VVFVSLIEEHGQIFTKAIIFLAYVDW